MGVRRRNWWPNDVCGKVLEMYIKFLVVVGFLLAPTLARAEQTTWDAPYKGDDPKLLYLPDTKATYWRYGWERKQGDLRGLILRGKIPDVRYFSYNVYDDNTKSSLGSLADFQIIPDDGGINPFTGKNSNSHSSYSILVLPKGTKTDAKNVLYFPDELTKVSLFLRHYVSKGGMGGGVPLPTVAIYDPNSKSSHAAPVSSKIPALSKQVAKKYLVPMFKHLINEFEKNPDEVIKKLTAHRTGEPLNMKELIASQMVAKSFTLFKPGAKHHSLRLQTAGTYPNKDNYYLALPIIRTKQQSLLVRFKTPKLPGQISEFPKTEVRYFSISQGDAQSYTHGTTMDAEMKIDDDGFANFLIADDTPEMATKAKTWGANFMPWLAGDKMLLIYRHMLPNPSFKHGIDKVPSYVSGKPAADQIAIKTIGDYAMIGKLVASKSIPAMKVFPKF